MTDYNPQFGFEIANQASASVAADIVADVNTLALSYPTAVQLANTPRESVLIGVPKGPGIAGVTWRFLLHHATGVNDKQALVNLWRYDGPGSPFLVASINLTAGQAIMDKHPVTGKDLGAGQWAYTDNLAVIEENQLLTLTGRKDANGIMEVSFHLRGSARVFADFKCDGGPGGAPAASDDALSLVKWW